MIKGEPPNLNQNPLKVLHLIAMNGTPTIVNLENLSPTFCDYLPKMLEVDADSQTTRSHVLHLPTLPPLASGHVLQNKPALSQPWLGGLASLTHVPVSLSPLLFTSWPVVVRSYCFAPIFSSCQPLNNTPCLPILPPLASGHALQNKPALSRPWLGGLASFMHVPVSPSPLLFTLCSHLLFSFLQLGAIMANDGNNNGNVTMATVTAVATMTTVIT